MAMSRSQSVAPGVHAASMVYPPAPGGAYYATMAAGLAGSLMIILTSLPLLRRLTGAAGVRFE